MAKLDAATRARPVLGATLAMASWSLSLLVAPADQASRKLRFALATLAITS